VDNAMTGHEWLRRTMGDACPNHRCVRFGWQIDMFSGYSKTTPQLWSMMGYDGMVIRFEGPDDMRQQWGQEQAFEFLWVGGDTLPANRIEILTHVLRWNYCDMLESCNPPACTDPSRAPVLPLAFSSPVLTSHDLVVKYAHALVDWARASLPVYQGPFLAAWGCDFQFTNATMWFDQMDLIVEEISNNPDVYNATVQYSTLANYFDSLHALNLTFPRKTNVDFEFGWPHEWMIGSTGNVSVQYQTGAPSSWASHKRHIRRTAALTRAAAALHARALANHSLPRSRGDDFMVPCSPRLSTCDARRCDSHGAVTGGMGRERRLHAPRQRSRHNDEQCIAERQLPQGHGAAQCVRLLPPQPTSPFIFRELPRPFCLSATTSASAALPPTAKC
jgi:hypothetical protein